jgi:TetR/AcrR family transcriptional repressor of nem operon
MVEATASWLAQTLANNEGLDFTGLFKLYVSRDRRDARSVSCTMGSPLRGPYASTRGDQGDTCWWARSMLAALEHKGATLAEADQHNVRAKMIDIHGPCDRLGRIVTCLSE